MSEKPRGWTPRVIEGGRTGNTPASEPTSKPLSIEPVPTTAPIPERATPSEDMIRPEEMIFALAKGGWKQEGGASGEGTSEVSKETDLVRIYLDLSGKPPANFETSVRPHLMKEATKIVPSWSVDSLHKYLSSNEVWKRPSFTKAVFKEINARMLRGKMDPRE